ERDEADELDRDDDQDRLLEQRPVVDGNAVVEAQLEREVPRPRDEEPVRDQVPDTVPVDRDHQAAGTIAAWRTASTIRSCVAASMPAQIGTEKFSRASCSVTGSEPSSRSEEHTSELQSPDHLVCR